MTGVMDEARFIKHLKKGVKRTSDLMAQVTEYHGKPVATEYLLTADCAREFMEAGYEVRVEAIYRKLVNALTGKKGWWPSIKHDMRSQRADLALLYTDLVLTAVVEIKIGVATFRPLEPDLEKITTCFSYVKPEHRKRLIGAAVFQVHVPVHKKRWRMAALRRDFAKKIRAIRSALFSHAKQNPSYRFKMISLQSARAGIVERAREYDPMSGEDIPGAHGHITRYYVIIVRSK